jgi:hypothetical protein
MVAVDMIDLPSGWFWPDHAGFVLAIIVMAFTTAHNGRTALWMSVLATRAGALHPVISARNRPRLRCRITDCFTPSADETHRHVESAAIGELV